jgi:phytanoyl-CoA hydroxylase
VTHLDALNEKGFVVVRGAVALSLCDEINDRIDVFKRRNTKPVSRNQDEHGRLSRVVNLHVAVGAMTRLLTENTAIEVCDEFLQATTSLYTSLYYERGSEQPLHRDTPLFSTTPPEKYLGVWSALDEVGDDNGPLMVVAGSHKLPALDIQAMRRSLFGDARIDPLSPKGWETYQVAVQEQCKDFELYAQPIHVSKGDVIVWHPQLLHGGAPHLSPRTRRSVVMHVTPQATPVGHMDVFFDPARQTATKAGWSYYRRGSRYVAKQRVVDFGHAFSVKAWRLRKA